MSKLAEAHVWRHSRAKGSNLLVLLKIADLSTDEGRDCWLSAKTIAGWCRLTVRASRYILHKLEREGELIIDLNTERRPVHIGRRLFVPEWFLHLRCVCEWEAYEHETQAEKFASSGFKVGRKASSAHREKISAAASSTTGKDFTATGSGLPANRKNHVPHKRNDPLVDPLVEYKQGPGPDPPLKMAEDPDLPADNINIITKLAHTALEQLGPDHEDLTETVKCLCARYRITYDSGVVRKAIESAVWQRGHRSAEGG